MSYLEKYNSERTFLVLKLNCNPRKEKIQGRSQHKKSDLRTWYLEIKTLLTVRDNTADYNEAEAQDFSLMITNLRSPLEQSRLTQCFNTDPAYIDEAPCLIISTVWMSCGCLDSQVSPPKKGGKFSPSIILGWADGLTNWWTAE